MNKEFIPVGKDRYIVTNERGNFRLVRTDGNIREILLAENNLSDLRDKNREAEDVLDELKETKAFTIFGKAVAAGATLLGVVITPVAAYICCRELTIGGILLLGIGIIEYWLAVNYGGTILGRRNKRIQNTATFVQTERAISENVDHVESLKKNSNFSDLYLPHGEEYDLPGTITEQGPSYVFKL